MFKKRFLVFVLLLTVFTTGCLFGKEEAPSSGEFSVLFDVEGLTTDAPQTVRGKVAGHGVTSISLSRGPGLHASGLTNGFAATNWAIDNPTLEGAIENKTYFEFGLSVNDGFTVTLEKLDLSLRRSAANGPMDYELQASLDNFATPGITVDTFTYYGRTSGTYPDPNPLDKDPYYYMHSDLPGHPNTATSPGDPIPTVDLSTIKELKNIPAGTDVTFRLYAWGNDKTTATNSVSLGRMDGPEITGLFETTSKK